MIENNSKTYQWVIATLVGVLCLAIGILIQSERLKTNVDINTVEIRIIKEQFRDIQIKLDRILEDKR